LIIDTSALVAMMRGEEKAFELALAVASHDGVFNRYLSNLNA
jgi:uncharacterized protein with PIN domain